MITCPVCNKVPENGYLLFIRDDPEEFQFAVRKIESVTEELIKSCKWYSCISCEKERTNNVSVNSTVNP